MADVERVILVRVVPDRQTLAEIEAAIPGAEIEVYFLAAPMPVIEERIRSKQVPTAYDWCVGRASELTSHWEATPLDAKVIESSSKTPSEIAEEIVGEVAGLGTGRGPPDAPGLVNSRRHRVGHRIDFGTRGRLDNQGGHMSIQRSQKRILGAALATLVVAVTLIVGGSASGDSGRPYLALGDSVSFGYITQAGFEYRNPDNFIGFPTYVGLALGRAPINASCPGEATGGFISPTGTDNGCRLYKANFPLHTDYSGTQLAFATAFLNSHPNTKLVTLQLEQTTRSCSKPRATTTRPASPQGFPQRSRPSARTSARSWRRSTQRTSTARSSSSTTTPSTTPTRTAPR